MRELAEINRGPPWRLGRTALVRACQLLLTELPLRELADADGHVIQELKAKLLLEADLLDALQLRRSQLPSLPLRARARSAPRGSAANWYSPRPLQHGRPGAAVGQFGAYVAGRRARGRRGGRVRPQGPGAGGAGGEAKEVG